MGKSDKTEEKKKVYCNVQSKDNPEFLTFAEFILTCETELVTNKSVKVYGATTTDTKQLQKWAKDINIVVNSYLSKSAQDRVHLKMQSVEETLTWAIMRKMLMSCFGADTLNESDELGKLLKILQAADETPSTYLDRLIVARSMYVVAVDFRQGDGLRNSAAVRLTAHQANYPYYFIEDTDSSTVLKVLYYQGLLKVIRNAWESARENSDITWTDLQKLVRWCENWYQKRREKKRNPELVKRGALHQVTEPNSSDEEETKTKRTKDDKPGKYDKILNTMINTADKMFTSVDKMILTINQSKNDAKFVAIDSSQDLYAATDVLDGIFAVSRQRKLMPTNTGCWICKSTDHYAPKCPVISRTEVFIMTINQLYKANLVGKKTPGYVDVTLDEACSKWGIPAATPKESQQLDSLYQPLRNKTPRGLSKGRNDKAYCHFCHANGHYIRDCHRQCIFCFEKGHNWKSCTDPQYLAVVKTRISLQPNGGTQNTPNNVTTGTFNMSELFGSEGNDQF